MMNLFEFEQAVSDQFKIVNYDDNRLYLGDAYLLANVFAYQKLNGPKTSAVKRLFQLAKQLPETVQSQMAYVFRMHSDMVADQQLSKAIMLNDRMIDDFEFHGVEKTAVENVKATLHEFQITMHQFDDLFENDATAAVALALIIGSTIPVTPVQINTLQQLSLSELLRPLEMGDTAEVSLTTDGHFKFQPTPFFHAYNALVEHDDGQLTLANQCQFAQMVLETKTPLTNFIKRANVQATLNHVHVELNGFKTAVNALDVNALKAMAYAGTDKRIRKAVVKAYFANSDELDGLKAIVNQVAGILTPVLLQQDYQGYANGLALALASLSQMAVFETQTA